MPEVTLSGPEQIPAGSPFDIEFTGRGGPGDIVFWSKPEEPLEQYFIYNNEGRQDALEGDIENGSPLSLIAPVEEGEYEIRFYNVNHGGLLAQHSIIVTPPNVNIDIPESVDAGSRFVVEVDGPDAPGDIVFLATAEWENNMVPKDISNQYLSSAKTIEIVAPRQPGNYEIRYFSGGNAATLFKKQFEVY